MSRSALLCSAFGRAGHSCEQCRVPFRRLQPTAPASSAPAGALVTRSRHFRRRLTRRIPRKLAGTNRRHTSQTQYDAAGRVSTLIYPDGSEVLRTYTARGQRATLAVDSTTIDTRTYDDGGRLISSSDHNGVGETRVHNDDNTLATISYSGAAIGGLSYTWDANQNKTSESIGGVMSGYGFTASYDPEDRLIGWDRSDTNLDQSWDLSPVGDWNSITENLSVQNRTHGPVHEILTASGQAVQHDPRGNMTLIPPALRPGSDPLKLKWDFDNKLRAADTDNDGVDDVFYRWDALGRRVGRDDGTTSVVYFQDGQQTLADYPAGAAAGSPTYTYVYASYIDEVVLRSGGSGTRYYHRNGQYSITALTNVGGSIVERYAYTAYGQVTFASASGTVQTASASNNRYTYTGREWDEGLSLYHFRARMYDPVSGRFVSRDPIGFRGGAYNIFAFLQINPILYLDPSGLKTVVSPTRPRPVRPSNGRTPIGPYYPRIPGWKYPPEELLNPLRCMRDRTCMYPEGVPPGSPTSPSTIDPRCKPKSPCEKKFPGIPKCRYPYIYNTAGRACLECNEPGYRPGRPVPIDSTDGVVLPTHYSCIKNRRPGDSIICGTCCIETLNGDAHTASRCKCAPQRNPDNDDFDDFDDLFD